MIPTLGEIKANLLSVLCYMRFKKADLAAFSVDDTNFWKSFFAAVICLPGSLYLTFIQPSDIAPTIDAFAVYIIESIFYVIYWIIYPVFMHALLTLHKKEANFRIFVINYNWLQVWQIVVFVIIHLVLQMQILSDASAGFLTFISLLYILVAQTFMTKQTLETNWFSAGAFVFFNIILTQAVYAINKDMMFI